MDDPHLKLDDVNDLTIEEMKQHMKDMEDRIILHYIEMTSCYVCPKCMKCENNEVNC